MSEVKITFTWTFPSNFHIGSGLAEYAGLDRLIRVDPRGNPYLSGDAIKGAVRCSAERLARWIGLPTQAEKIDEPHFPMKGPMQNIFQLRERSCSYYFSPGRAVGKNLLVHLSSTAIDPETGAAQKATLRTTQAAHKLAFECQITGRGGDWTDGRDDYWDLLFLSASVVSTTAIGGHKSVGLGSVQISDLCCDRVARLPNLLSEECTVKELIKELWRRTH